MTHIVIPLPAFQSAGKDYLYTYASQFICLIIGAASSILVARLLQPAGRGEMAIIQYFPNLAGTLFCFAIPQATSHCMAANPERAHQHAAASIHFGFVMGIAGACLFAFVAPLMLSPADGHLAFQVSLACLASPSIVIVTNLLYVHRGFKQFLWVNAVQVFGAFAFLVMVLILWSLKSVSPLSIVLAVLVSQYGAAILCLIRIGPSTWLERQPLAVYRALFLQGARYFWPILALTVYQMSDRIILMHTTSLREIGFYAVAVSFTLPLTQVVEPFVQIGFVHLSAARDGDAIKRLFAKQYTLAQAALICAVVPLVAMLYPFVHLTMGAAYLPAVIVAALCGIAMAISGLGRIAESGLRSLNVNTPGIVGSVAAFVCLVGLSTALVPHHGARAFAAILVLTESIRLSILLVSGRGRLYNSWRDLLVSGRSWTELLDYVRVGLSRAKG